MNTFTSNASLIIHPENPNWFPDKPEEIIASLEQTGLIAKEMQDEKQSYFVGDSFLELIAFMGCSPNINLSPQDSTEQFCFIRLITKLETSSLTSQHTHAPLCPHCKKPEKNWSDKITNTSLQCSSCGHTANPWLYNWRKSAGFGRFFIEVTEIYPKEAIPQNTLLTALKKQSGSSWTYFYLCS